MKIVDAYWEKRNLGLDCVEISIELSDTATEFESRLKNIDAPYTVVKVPSNKSDILFNMTELGFTFVETLLNYVHNLKSIELTGIHKRLDNAIYYEKMNDNDFTQLYKEMQTGIFKTDRISLDPFFSCEIAAQRYLNWIRDEIARDTAIYKVCYKKDSIGFFTFKETDKDIYYPFLAGLYSKYNQSGLGMYIIQKTREECVKRQAKGISTYVSSNNISVIKVHNMLRYTFNKINYIFVKHNNQEA